MIFTPVSTNLKSLRPDRIIRSFSFVGTLWRSATGDFDRFRLIVFDFDKSRLILILLGLILNVCDGFCIAPNLGAIAWQVQKLEKKRAELKKKLAELKAADRAAAELRQQMEDFETQIAEVQR